MATKQSTIDFILEQIFPADFVTAKKMFGEYALYADGKVVALVCDDQLFVKITPPGKALAGGCAEAPPYPGAKPCLLISGDRCEDREWLSQLFQITAANLPKPQKKPAKKKIPNHEPTPTIPAVH
jgi:TfoX/Sxy family transcriptional regulator of competence genes